MINDSMKSNKLIGMIQPKKTSDKLATTPDLHNIGCLGKITSFKETEDRRYLIELKGLIRFEVKKEIKTSKKYRNVEACQALCESRSSCVAFTLNTSKGSCTILKNVSSEVSNEDSISGIKK